MRLYNLRCTGIPRACFVFVSVSASLSKLIGVETGEAPKKATLRMRADAAEKFTYLNMGLTKRLNALMVGLLGGCLYLAGYGCVWAGDLLSSLELAWSRDPVLQAAVVAHQTSLARIAQARAALLPTVNLTAQNNVSNGSYEFSNSDPTSRPLRNSSQTLQLTQPIYRPQLVHALRQAELLAGQTLEQLRQAEQDLMLRLLQAYSEVQTARDHQDYISAQLKLQAQQLAVAQKGLALGTHAQPEVDDALSKYAAAQSQVVEAATQWRIKRQELSKITGELSLSSGTQWGALSDDYSLGAWLALALVIDVNQWMQQARIDSPAVRAQMAAVDAAAKEIQKNRIARMPVVDFTVSRTHSQSAGNASSAQNFDSSSRVTQVGVQLTIPLYDGGGSHAKIQEAQSGWDKAQFELDSAQLLAESTVLQAWESLEASKAQAQALQTAMDAARAAVQGNIVGVQHGKRTLAQVYDSEQQLAAVKRDWRKVRYDLILQVAKLKASIGNLQREDFIELNKGFRFIPATSGALSTSSALLQGKPQAQSENSLMQLTQFPHNKPMDVGGSEVEPINPSLQ